jgi:pantoate--beta-alanine ligase
MMLARTVEALRATRNAIAPDARVGFVPTMGALHAGHAALFRTARTEVDFVVASLFVNPKQFDDPADLAKYPRDEARDAAVAKSAGVDLLFVPDATEIYPPGHVTTVHVGGPAEGFEGAARAGHFDGVATVCLALFNIVSPDVAYLGQKDAQQVAVLRQLVRDMHLPLQIRVVPTVREDDGLALSSRNVHLPPEERARAAAIPRSLRAGLAAYRDGRDPVAAARAELHDLAIDYVAVTDFHGVKTLVVAVRAGRTRLIDNLPLDDPGLAGLPS